MKVFETKRNFQPAYARSTRRPKGEKASMSLPRLVVNDAASATKVIVAKTRSEIAGLNSLLRSITAEPLKSK